MKTLIRNFKKDIRNRYQQIFVNKYKKVGFTWLAVKRMRALDGNAIHPRSFLGKKIYFRSGQELLHAIDEIFVEEFYKVPLPNNAFIIDCGAHIGTGVIYLKNKYPDARLIAFEPDNKNFEVLKLNVESFGFTNVELVNEAVWNENTTISFSHTGSMGSSISEHAQTGNDVSIVKTRRLRDLLNQPVHFLKLDVEGAEYNIIKDIAPELHRIQFLFIEYHGLFSNNNQLNEILSIVVEAGFSYYIKEATVVYKIPFERIKEESLYDVQLNIFCFRS